MYCAWRYQIGCAGVTMFENLISVGQGMKPQKKGYLWHIFPDAYTLRLQVLTQILSSLNCLRKDEYTDKDKSHILFVCQQFCSNSISSLVWDFPQGLARGCLVMLETRRLEVQFCLEGFLIITMTASWSTHSVEAIPTNSFCLNKFLSFVSNFVFNRQ